MKLKWFSFFIFVIVSKFFYVNAYNVEWIDMEVHPRGFWSGPDVKYGHAYDQGLAQGLVDFFIKERVSSVVDLGCGMGDYVHCFLKHDLYAKGYDGNPDTVELTSGVAEVADLSELMYLNEKFDWVLSLEVGEHIPKEFENTFIENLHRNNLKGIVLSWAIKAQGLDFATFYGLDHAA